MRISDWSSDVCSSELGDRAAEAAVDAVMRRQEIEHRGHESLVLGELQLAHGHVPAQDVGMFAALEMVALAAAEIGELDRNRVIAALDRKSTRLNSSH